MPPVATVSPSTPVSHSKKLMTLADYLNSNVEAEKQAEKNESLAQFLRRVFSFSGNLDDLGASCPLAMIEPESSLDSWSKRNMKSFVQINSSDDPVERMSKVLTSELENLSFFSHKSKKPLNPIIGECFNCTYGDKVVLQAEQLSHHPPVAGLNYQDTKGDVSYTHIINPDFRLGSSGMNFCINEKGSCTYRIESRDETYSVGLPQIIIQPTASFFMNARVSLFLGETLTVKCNKTKLVSRISFEKAGWIKGYSSNFNGTIEDFEGKILAEVFGSWKGEMWIKRDGILNLVANGSICPRFSGLKRSIPDRLDETHSFNVWGKVTSGMKAQDSYGIKEAGRIKKGLESWQRKYLGQLKELGLSHSPRYFVRNESSWHFKNNDGHR